MLPEELKRYPIRLVYLLPKFQEWSHVISHRMVSSFILYILIHLGMFWRWVTWLKKSSWSIQFPLKNLIECCTITLIHFQSVREVTLIQFWTNLFKSEFLWLKMDQNDIEARDKIMVYFWMDQNEFLIQQVTSQKFWIKMDQNTKLVLESKTIKAFIKWFIIELWRIGKSSSFQLYDWSRIFYSKSTKKWQKSSHVYHWR